MAYHYNSWPLIGQKSAHGQFEFFNTVTLICSLSVSQGQKGGNNMWPLKTNTRGHGRSEPLPSAEGSGGEVYQPSIKVVKLASPLQRVVVVKRLNILRQSCQ